MQSVDWRIEFSTQIERRNQEEGAEWKSKEEIREFVYFFFEEANLTKSNAVEQIHASHWRYFEIFPHLRRG